MADAATWARRVEEWRASGESAPTYARGRGFAPSTLRWWASRLGRRETGFVRVVTASRDREEPITIEIRDARIVVPGHFDRAALAAIVDVVRAGGAGR